MADDKTPITYMPVGEFLDLGFLQEVNRLVLHPAGLALEVTISADPDGDGPDPTKFIVRVWDYRSDPEGILYGPGEISAEKIGTVQAEQLKHDGPRIEILSQPGQKGYDTNVHTGVVQRG